MRAVRSTRCPVIGHANFFFFFLYRRATRSDGIFIADLACLRNWTPTDGGSRPNPAAFIYAKRDQKRSTHVYRVARKNRQQLTATYPLKGMDDFHHTGRVRFATRGFWGKGVGFIISDNERCFTNDSIDSTRGEGGIFWNWDNREIFIPANNVPRSLSKHQDSLLSSIIEPGQRNFLIPSNVKRILEFYLAMNHSRISLRNRCFLLSSRVERERQLNLGLRNQIRGIESRSTRGFAGKGEDWQRSVQNYRSSAECCSHGNISLSFSLSLSGERVHPPFVARQLKLALLITRCRDAC